MPSIAGGGSALTVRLRAHHLLCTLAYIGEGYNSRFIENYDAIARRIADGVEIHVVAGPDDICEPLLTAANCHCEGSRAAQRDARAVSDLARILGLEAMPGTSLRFMPQRIARLRTEFRDGSIRSACTGCRWANLCGAVAAAGFAEARIAP